MATLIIAEAGVNHNGDLGLARRMIAIAAESGADMVKFQTFSADRLVTANAAKADYQTRNSCGGETQLAMLRRLELSEQAHIDLIEECDRNGIEFFSTGFDDKDIDLLIGMGLQKLKVPSGEITNLPLLRHIGAQGKEVLLSTGMSTLAEVESALKILETSGTRKENITVLHCTSDYPAAMADVNLRAMVAMRDNLDVEVGYSDHTPGIDVAIASVALGASVIEKHFTIDRGLPGPDHLASLEPDELKAMIRSIRNIEKAMGSQEKKVAAGEEQNRLVARRSLVAVAEIKQGEKFSADNVAAKRPAVGICPMQWDNVIGCKAPRDFTVDEPIEL